MTARSRERCRRARAYNNTLLMREFAAAATASGFVTRAIANAGGERAVAPGG